MIVTSKQYPSRELLESDILQYRTDLIAHAQTVGIPAPLPPNDLVEVIVKNEILWVWEDVTDAPEPDPTPEPLQGYDFVSDMYNDFLSKKFYYDELQDYQKSRVDEYPPVGDQLDALFKAGIFPEAMAAQIREVKNRYPKPSPFPSWVYNSLTCSWEPPVAYPTDGKQYIWDENTTSWTEVE